MLIRFLKLVLDSSSRTLFTGDSEKERNEAKAQFSRALQLWLSRSLSVAPSKASALIQECVLLDSETGTIVLDSIGEISLSLSLCLFLFLWFCKGKLGRPFIFSLEKKARIVGEVHGFGDALSDDGILKLEQMENVSLSFRSLVWFFKFSSGHCQRFR